MERSKKKLRGRGAKGAPPRSEENRYVITFEDTRAYRGEIVAVNGFPVLGGYSKVVAHANTVEELKLELGILGMLEDPEGSRSGMTVHVVPGLEVWCYVSASRRKLQVIRRGTKR